ncbi:hypothetical protein GEV33_006116 [Tenebrio molitor]|uniref:Uncharacterized protein n=1 Tax=Tenebrio molitor TaxID=7067 RepID=A0A8J6HL43_TENMO|nr:hypothetical protein GEV33_006116 [Tenebrio molitor]
MYHRGPCLMVGMILGIVGACRREDLYTMRIEDFEEREGLVIVKVPQKKRSFIVINEPDEKAHYLDIYYKYRNLRPSHAKSSHFFLNYRNEKCTNQVIGKGTIGSWPSKIAEYLKLKNPAGYTDPGLKRHGGCKSSITAEKDCVENNIQLQEDKENSEYENFDNANVSTNPLVCFQDNNTDDQTDNVVEAKAEADDAGLRLETSEATSEDNSNELGYDSVDYADEIQTELDDCDVYVRTTEASFEEVNETSHDRADQISEVNTKANDIDIEEELRNPSQISSVHARKRKTLDMEHALMNLTDAVKAMKSPLQEDEDLAFFYSLLPLRVHFVHSSPLLQKRLRLRQSDLDKKTMFFFETTCIERRDPTDSFQSYSGVEEALVHKWTQAPTMESTVRPLQRAAGNNG